MKHLTLFLLCLWLTYPAAGQVSDTLLNDTSLAGWHVRVKGSGIVPVDSQHLFVWEDSLLHVLPDAPAGTQQPFAALVTDSVYQSYTLTLEYRWGEKKFVPRMDAPRDAGVLFHVQRNTSFWPTSLEYQIQEDDTGDIWLIGTRAVSMRSADKDAFDPAGTPTRRAGKRYVRFTRRPVTERQGWNTVRIEVDGRRAQYYLNGEPVNGFTEAEWRSDEDAAWEPLSAGRIALQAEGAEVFYRNVVLKKGE